MPCVHALVACLGVFAQLRVSESAAVLHIAVMVLGIPLVLHVCYTCSSKQHMHTSVRELHYGLSFECISCLAPLCLPSTGLSVDALYMDQLGNGGLWT